MISRDCHNCAHVSCGRSHQFRETDCRFFKAKQEAPEGGNLPSRNVQERAVSATRRNTAIYLLTITLLVDVRFTTAAAT